MAKRQKRKIKKIEVFKTGLKRFSAGFLALFLILSQVQAFEAWEAHIINVTATIVQPCEQSFWIDGYKFYDRNGDSNRAGGEEGLPGWIIELEKLFDRRYDYNDDGLNDGNDIAILQDVADDLIECPNGKVCDLNGDGWVDDLDVGLYPSYPKDFGNYLTDENGYYEFKTLEPGKYRINEALQTGWLPTTPTNGELTFDLACGENKVDFGNIHDSGPRCGDGIPDPGEECDDGNLINGDGCSADCTIERGECGALSIGYWQNHEGCPEASNWTTEINTLSLNTFQGAFATSTGAEICNLLAPSNCPSAGTLAGKLCRAKGKSLADLSNLVSNRLALTALIAGTDDGNSAFDNLGLSSTSTVEQLLDKVEAIIVDPNHTANELTDAAYVAERLYSFYEDENPTRPECIYPACGNSIKEGEEQCDDGNLIDGDGCSSQCTNEGCVLEFLKVGTPNPVVPGGQLTYNLQLTNIGTEDCTGSGVELEEHYDANTVFVGAVPQPTTGNNSWNLGELAPGDNRQITVTMQVSDMLNEGNILTNQACFRAAQYPDWVCINQETQVLAPTEEQNIVINEFLPNPPGNDGAPMPNGEWVELYNRGATDIDVENWVLYDNNNSHELFITSANTTSSSTIVPAGGFLVIFRNGDTDFQLNNTGGDSVRLYTGEISQGAILVDSHTYTINAAVNKSFARIPDGSENWVDPYPTPGEDNRLPTEDDPPIDLSNEPLEEPEIEDDIQSQEEMPATIFGCADQNNIFINQDNGGCTYLILGCNDPLALNYNPAANQSDNSCLYPILDCVNDQVIDYISDTIENNSCLYSEPERQDDPVLESDPEPQPEPEPDSNYDSNPE